MILTSVKEKALREVSESGVESFGLKTRTTAPETGAL